MSDDTLSPARQSDRLDPARAQALQAVLGRVARIDEGDALPPFFHQIYFWNALPASELGRDGHPRTGQGLVPDLGLPRRMWAGGRLTFQQPLRAGVIAQCESRLLRAERKTGKTGPLGLVTIGYDIVQNGQVCVQEERDLIYREDHDASAPVRTLPAARNDETVSQRVDFNSTMLFRYSALTFNGHRIHYDLDYANDVEGYSGLVVHGPLLAQLLMVFAQDALGPLKTFRFRATAPLMHFEPAELCLSGTECWVRGPKGRLCMTADIGV